MRAFYLPYPSVSLALQHKGFVSGESLAEKGLLESCGHKLTLKNK